MPGLLQHSPQRIIGALFTTTVCNGNPVAVDPDVVNHNEGSLYPSKWPVYIDREPDRPDNLIKVSGTQGVSFGFTQVDGEREEWNGVQVLVRAVDDTTGWQKIAQLSSILDSILKRTIRLPLPDDGFTDTGTGTGTGTGPLVPGPGSAFYVIASVERTTEPTYVGRDVPQGKRVLYTVNALCVIRQCT